MTKKLDKYILYIQVDNETGETVIRTEDENYIEDDKINKYRDDLNGDDIYRGLKEGELTEKETVDLLNKLNDENEHLKKSVKRQQSSNNECAKLIKEQQKETEQLKQQIKDMQIRFKRKYDYEFDEIVDELE